MNTLHIGMAVLLAAAPLVAQTPFTDKLLREITNEDAAVRGTAVRELSGLVPTTRVLDALGRGLRDSDPSVRKAAINATKLMHSDAISFTPELVLLLSEEQTAAEAAEALAALGTGGDKAVTEIARLLRLEGHLSHSRYKFAVALPQVGGSPDRVIPLLWDLRHDPNERVREVAFVGLAVLLPPNRSRELTHSVFADENESIRAAAVAILAYLPVEGSTVPMLAVALNDPAEAVRTIAVEMLQRIGQPENWTAIPNLAEIVADDAGPLNTRTKALRLLAEMDKEAPEVEAYLQKATRSANSGMAREARKALARRHGEEPPQQEEDEFGAVGAEAAHVAPPVSPEAVQQLIRDLSSGEQAVRANAAGTLARIGPDGAEAGPALVRALGDLNRETKLAASEALLSIGVKGVPVLLLALKDDNSWVRSNAVQILGKFGEQAGPEAAEALARIARIDELYIRRQALTQLPRMAAVPSIPETLVGALRTDELRSEAFHALRKMGERAASAFPALLSLLNHQDDGIVASAAVALARTGKSSPEAIAKLEELLASSSPNVRSNVIGALTIMGEGTALAAPSVVHGLRDPDPRNRTSSVRSLVEAHKLGALSAGAAAAVVRDLAVLLDDEAVAVRSSVVQAITAMATPPSTAWPILEGVLTAKSSSLRWQAATYLQEFAVRTGEPERIVPYLVRALSDPDQQVRSQAAMLLGKTGRHALPAVPALAEALSDSSLRVRWEARTAMKRISTEPNIATKD